MKTTLVLLATVYLFTACNSGSQTSTSTEDTTSASTSMDNSTMAAQASAAQDTTMPGNGLMKVHEDMMNRMHSMKMSGDFDVDWANMMIEHHQGAIDMARVELSQGKDEKMKSKAQEILTKQKDEQDKIRDIVKNLKPSDMKMGAGELEKSMSDMMSKMSSMQMSGNVDKDFATMMIHHHEDGIAMAKKEIANGMNSELKNIAQKSVPEQTKDISELKSMMASIK